MLRLGKLERVEIYFVFEHIFLAIPHDCPPITKSLLSTFSTGPRYNDTVRGTPYVMGVNPGGRFEKVL